MSISLTKPISTYLSCFSLTYMYTESIVNMAFEHVTQIYNTRFGIVVSQGAFADLIVCLTEFSKNTKFQKKSLQAIEALKSTVVKMLKTPECPLSRKHSKSVSEESRSKTVQQLSIQSQEEQFWYPILISFQDILMTGDDLEVRSRYGDVCEDNCMKATLTNTIGH